MYPEGVRKGKLEGMQTYAVAICTLLSFANVSMDGPQHACKHTRQSNSNN